MNTNLGGESPTRARKLAFVGCALLNEDSGWVLGKPSLPGQQENHSSCC